MKKSTIDSHITAAKVAAEVASEAANVARDVAKTASEAAEKVAQKAQETADKVLLFAQDLQYIKTDVKEIKERLDNRYVTIESFKPVQKIVYGLVGLIISSVVVALLALVVTHK